MSTVSVLGMTRLIPEDEFLVVHLPSPLTLRIATVPVSITDEPDHEVGPPKAGHDENRIG